MTGWIQKHDFSSDDLGTISKSEAIEMLNSFDWDSELQKEVEMTQRGQESCNPGIGFISEDGAVLHIVPTQKGNLIHFFWKQDTKNLGLFRTSRSMNASGSDFSPKATEEIIHSHFLSANEITRELVREG